MKKGHRRIVVRRKKRVKGQTGEYKKIARLGPNGVIFCKHDTEKETNIRVGSIF